MYTYIGFIVPPSDLFVCIVLHVAVSSSLGWRLSGTQAQPQDRRLTSMSSWRTSMNKYLKYTKTLLQSNFILNRRIYITNAENIVPSCQDGAAASFAVKVRAKESWCFMLTEDAAWHREWGSNPGPLDSKSVAIPPGHRTMRKYYF